MLKEKNFKVVEYEEEGEFETKKIKVIVKDDCFTNYTVVVKWFDNETNEEEMCEEYKVIYTNSTISIELTYTDDDIETIMPMSTIKVLEYCIEACEEFTK